MWKGEKGGEREKGRKRGKELREAEKAGKEAGGGKEREEEGRVCQP